MKTLTTRLADRMLARIVPRVEASASCSYYWSTCGCSGGLRRAKRCMSGCPGVPNHCYSCEVVGSC
ncbi:MAG TPA: hypothetical protein VD813_15660 [Pseudonocardia sp.]|nr:hypothetical protein [Pseudonocardia sp.]